MVSKLVGVWGVQLWLGHPAEPQTKGDLAFRFHLSPLTAQDEKNDNTEAALLLHSLAAKLN